MKEKYFAIYIDALFLNPRSDILGNDLLNIALGIDLDGKKEILRFWTNPTESSNI